jgi:NitT/TauT family transport system substrate-binding protein
MSTTTQPPAKAGARRFRRSARVRRTAAALLALSTLAATATACSSASGSGGGTAAVAATGNLKPLVVGVPSPAVTVFSANYAIGAYLGCYQRYGYKFSAQVTTNPAQLVAALHRGAVQIGVPGSDQYLNMINTISSSGSSLPLTAFYEADYPFKYGIAVKPGSSITSLSQLAGKKVGVDVLSDSSSPIFKAMLAANGVDPSSVTILATGVGAASGQALQSGKVDALFYYDVGYGTILQSGIKLQFLTINGKPPYMDVSGVLAVMPQSVYKSDPNMAKAFAECTTEGDIFVQTNPAAAAYIMLQMYPSLGKPGESLQQEISSLVLPLTLREKLLHSQDASVNYGEMNADEFKDDLTVILHKSADAMPVNDYFTNDQIPTLTDAQIAAVKKSATDFKIPGISGTLPAPSIPPNAP